MSTSTLPGGVSPQDILRCQPDLWDHYTRQEEYEPILLDKFRRFPYSASVCRSIFAPTVSEELHRNGLSPVWPEDHGFGVCLTHDIDWVFTSRFSLVHRAMARLKRKDLNGSYTTLIQGFRNGKRWPLCNFEQIIDLEEEYGARSSFFFLVQDPDEEDYSYEVEELGADLGRIHDRGCEVGLHGGFSCHRDLEQLLRRKARLSRVLGAPVLGYRNHYLCFTVPDTWELLARAGFLYDTTFGYHDCIGFRNGMCHPYIPFNRNLDREIPLFELPLVISDMALFTYMRFDPKVAWRGIRDLIDRISELHGVVTILWHNGSMLGDHLAGDHLDLYMKILQYCHEKNAWMGTCVDTVNWWKRQCHS